jgi:hypothetical protein
MRGAGRDWKRTSRGLAFGLGGWRLRAFHLMAGGLPSDEWHLTAGGLPSDVDSSLHVALLRAAVSGNSRAFYLTASNARSTRWPEDMNSSGGVVTPVTHDTWVLVKTSKFARTAPCFSRSSGTGTTTGRSLTWHVTPRPSSQRSSSRSSPRWASSPSRPRRAQTPAMARRRRCAAVSTAADRLCDLLVQASTTPAETLGRARSPDAAAALR